MITWNSLTTIRRTSTPESVIDLTLDDIDVAAIAYTSSRQEFLAPNEVIDLDSSDESAPENPSGAMQSAIVEGTSSSILNSQDLPGSIANGHNLRDTSVIALDETPPPSTFQKLVADLFLTGLQRGTTSEEEAEMDLLTGPIMNGDDVSDALNDQELVIPESPQVAKFLSEPAKIPCQSKPKASSPMSPALCKIDIPATPPGHSAMQKQDIDDAIGEITASVSNVDIAQVSRMCLV